MLPTVQVYGFGVLSPQRLHGGEIKALQRRLIKTEEFPMQPEEAEVRSFQRDLPEGLWLQSNPTRSCAPGSERRRCRGIKGTLHAVRHATPDHATHKPTTAGPDLCQSGLGQDLRRSARSKVPDSHSPRCAWKTWPQDSLQPQQCLGLGPIPRCAWKTQPVIPQQPQEFWEELGPRFLRQSQLC